MLNFTFHVPTRFVFGRGVEAETGREIKKLGYKKALIHYGGGSVIKSGLLKTVTDALDREGIAHVSLGGVVPNPRASLVYEGIELGRRENVDFILAVGGGSALDSAKAIALGIPDDGDFWDFFTGAREPIEAVPVGCVLTLAATGSESSNSTVITREETKEKLGLGHQLNRPALAILNPELTCTLPAYQTACGVVDIMAHAMERYFTQTTDVDLTDRLCEAVITAVIRAARIAIKDPADYEARAQLMWAGTIAHNDTVGVGRVSCFASHRIEHELSAMYDVAHGAGLAVVFPAWLRYQLSIENNVMRLAQFAARIWGADMNFENPAETAMRGIECYEAFLKEIGMPVTMRELGARTEDIPELARRVRRAPDGTVGQYKKLNTEEIEAIFRIADR
ncbi:MAG: iron-containing alcohol dehydrogenase [Christensenellales bacterium]|jgi:alcohol dehydrogenase YqhD (iron-dependent ADH family)